jgi:hypothetical protein
MRNDCSRIEAEISALLDGELAAPEAAVVEAHVRSCPACAGLARDLAAVGRTMRASEASVPPEPVSTGFRARVLSTVGAERRGPRPILPLPVPAVRPLPFLPAAAAAAALLAAIAGGAWLGFRGVDREPVVVATAAPGALSAAGLLAEAEAHRAAGRTDLARSALLAAFGLAPEDPGVRDAFARAFDFEPDGGPAPPPMGDPRAPRAPTAAADGADHAAPDLWIGSWKFESAAAYDAFTAFGDRSRGLEMEVAARGETPAPGTVTVAADRPVPVAPDPFQVALASLEVGSAAGGDGSATDQGITVFPLSRPGSAGVAAAEAPLSLSGALESGRALVAESRGRSTATILVSNLDPDRPLLVMAGEILDGGRADRLVARDVLVAPGARNVAIPVYEAEAGRGSSHPFGSRFRSVVGVAGSRVRGLALGQADPDVLRAFLRDRLDVLGVTSLRRSLADAWSERGPAAQVLRRTVRPRVQEALRALQGPEVVGFAVAQGREILGVEVFGSHDLMLREARRLLEGCAIEAATYRLGGIPPTRADVAALIAQAGRGTAIRMGEGSPFEVGFVATSGGLLGSGVAREGAVVHASILPGGPGATGPVRGGKTGDVPSAGGQPSTSGGSGDGAPGAGNGGTGEGGTGAPPPSSGGSEGGSAEPPPPSGGRPR